MDAADILIFIPCFGGLVCLFVGLIQQDVKYYRKNKKRKGNL